MKNIQKLSKAKRYSMERYHKALGAFDDNGVRDFTRTLNKRRFEYSSHFFEQVRERFSICDQGKLGLMFQALELQACQCFEYYIVAGQIDKACYRLPFDADKDVILVLARNKYIVTVYSNSVWDKHETLNKAVYSNRVLVNA